MPVPIPQVIGSYHHAHGPYRTHRCLSLDEMQTDMMALFQVETDASYDIADYHIMPITRIPAAPAWLDEFTPRTPRSERNRN